MVNRLIHKLNRSVDHSHRGMRFGSSAHAKNLNERSDGSTRRAGFESRRPCSFAPSALAGHGYARAVTDVDHLPSLACMRQRSTQANDDGVAKSASTVGLVPERGGSAASLFDNLCVE